MKTRFDGKRWIGAFGVVLELKDMGTSHLLNTVKMLLQKPSRVQAILVDDIERATFDELGPWTPTNKDSIRKQSLHNATSLSTDELIEFVTNSTLFKAMLEELEDRGVNTQAVIDLYLTDEAFNQ